jgi:hypothetical protein
MLLDARQPLYFVIYCYQHCIRKYFWGRNNITVIYYGYQTLFCNRSSENIYKFKVKSL